MLSLLLICAMISDVNECELGLHQCLPYDQVCYNQPGTYSCVNADGTLTSPGFWTPDGGSRIHPEFPSPKQRFPPFQDTRNPFQSFNEADISKGICPVGYNFNLQTSTCDGRLNLSLN